MLVPPNVNVNGQNSGTMIDISGRRHRRLSSLNTVSWPNPNELAVNPRTSRLSTFTASESKELKVIKFSLCLQKTQV